MSAYLSSSCSLTPSISLMSWITSPRTSAEELGPLAKKNSSTEFEWKNFLGFTSVGILNQIQQMMGELQREPENFTSRIIFTSMFNDIAWDAKGNEFCENKSKTIKKYARRFPRGHWSFLGPASEKEWY